MKQERDRSSSKSRRSPSPSSTSRGSPRKVARSPSASSGARRRAAKEDNKAPQPPLPVLPPSPRTQRRYTFNELLASPELSWLADNEWIRSGYRGSLNVKEAFLSLFSLHSETGNIWTHFLGAVIFLLLLANLLLFGVGAVARHDALASTSSSAVSSPTSSLDGRAFRFANQLFHCNEPSPSNPLLSAVSTVACKSMALGGNAEAEVEKFLALGGEALDAKLQAAQGLGQEAHEVILSALAAFSPAGDKLVRSLTSAGGLLALDDGHASAAAAATVPVWPIAVFIVSAVACMGVSALFHLFYIVSPYLNGLLSRLDYSFISLLIFGSQVPCIYYSFYCQPHLVVGYLSLAAVTNGANFVMGLSRRFGVKEWRGVRAASYVLAGAFGAIPFAHLLLVGDNSSLNAEGLWGLLLVGFLYTFGALLYALRIPERLKPGTFDVLFSSHQVFHLLVVAAALVHYRAVLSFYRHRVERPLCGVDAA